MRFIVLNAVILLACLACLPGKPPAPAGNTAISAPPLGGVIAGSTGALPSDLVKNTSSLAEVSAFSLDDLKFTILGVAVGLQDFMASQSPVLSFTLPRDADYVEVLRCRSDAVIKSGTEAISVVDLAISGMSEAEKASFYRRNDFFRGASENKGCELVAEALSGNSLVDTLAPSGSYRYLLRACVNPDRLTDRDKLSSRNCSMRVGVSPVLSGYVNARREAELGYLRQARAFANKLDHLGLRLRYLSSAANATLDYCENIEHAHKVDKKIRDSWITLGSATFEVIVEIETLDLEGKKGALEVARYYKDSILLRKGPGGVNEVLQLIGDVEGYMFSETLILLASSSQDMERSCARYKDLLDQAKAASDELASNGISYQYFSIQAKEAAQSRQLKAPSPAGTGTP